MILRSINPDTIIFGDDGEKDEEANISVWKTHPEAN